jgi:hypothetical protein
MPILVAWNPGGKAIMEERVELLVKAIKRLLRENKGEVRDFTILDSLLGKCMCDLLEASPGTVGDWSIFLQQNVLKGFEYRDENCRGQIHLENLAHYFFFELYAGSELKKFPANCSQNIGVAS